MLTTPVQNGRIKNNPIHRRQREGRGNDLRTNSLQMCFGFSALRIFSPDSYFYVGMLASGLYSFWCIENSLECLISVRASIIFNLFDERLMVVKGGTYGLFSKFSVTLTKLYYKGMFIFSILFIFSNLVGEVKCIYWAKIVSEKFTGLFNKLIYLQC